MGGNSRSSNVWGTRHGHGNQDGGDGGYNVRCVHSQVTTILERRVLRICMVQTTGYS